MEEQIVDQDYLDKTCQLLSIDDYLGKVQSITGEYKLITKAELKEQMLQAITEDGEAPIQVEAENGEHLNIISLYLSCLTQFAKEEEKKKEMNTDAKNENI